MSYSMAYIASQVRRRDTEWER